MTFDDSLYRFGQVLQQMPAVGHLLCLWRSLANRVRIGTSSIATDKLDLRMLPEPSGHCFRRAIRQKVQDSMLLQVHEDGAISVSPFISPVVDAHHAETSNRGQGELTQAAQ